MTYALNMSDALSRMLNEPHEQLSLLKPNIEWLSGIDGIEARLIITAVQCPGYPNQHYWTFLLQLAVPNDLDFTDLHASNVLIQADLHAYELRQTQKWFFRAEDIQFLPHSRKRRRDDDLNPFLSKRPRLMPGPSSFDTSPGPSSLGPTPGPLSCGLGAASVEGETAEEDHEVRPTPKLSEMSGADSTTSNDHGESADTEQVSTATNDTTPVECNQQRQSPSQGASGSQGAEPHGSNPRKRKTIVDLARVEDAEAQGHPPGARRYATPKSHYRGQSSLVNNDPMDWDKEPSTMQSSQAETRTSPETDNVVGATIAAGAPRRNEAYIVPELCSVDPDGSASPRDSVSNSTKAYARVDTLVRAVVQGAHRFQADQDLKSAWMKELKARPELCADAVALNDTFLKQVNAVSMNQWVSHLLYGCSELVLGPDRGRKNYQPSDDTDEMDGSPMALSESESSRASAYCSETTTASHEVATESGSGGNRDKRYRCRTLARIVIALINCLTTELEEAGAGVDQALNIIPALAGKSSRRHSSASLTDAVADCGFSQSNLRGWTKKNVEEGVKQAARDLMGPQKCKWRDIGQAYQIDPAHECRTKDMS